MVALIHDPLVTRRILQHLGLRDPEAVKQGPSQDTDPTKSTNWATKAQLPLEYVPVPDVGCTMVPPRFSLPCLVTQSLR